MAEYQIPRFVSELIADIPRLINSNKTVHNRIATEMEWDDPPPSDWDQIDEGVIEDCLESVRSSRKSLEEKARPALLGVPLLMSLSLASASLFTSDNASEVGVLLAIAISLTNVYFALAGIIAFTALGVDGVAQETPETHAEYNSQMDRNRYLLWCYSHNLNLNIVLSNRVSASLKCIRNGIVVLCAFVLVAIWARILSGDTTVNKDSQTHLDVQGETVKPIGEHGIIDEIDPDDASEIRNLTSKATRPRTNNTASVPSKGVLSAEGEDSLCEFDTAQSDSIE